MKAKKHRCETKYGWCCFQYDDMLILQVKYDLSEQHKEYCGKGFQNTLVNYCPFCGFSLTLGELSKSHLDEVLGL